MTVGDLCTRIVITAEPHETVVDAARRMRDRHVGTLVIVTNSDRKPIGLVTDRDLVVSALAQSPDKIDSLEVGDVMSRDLVTALPTESVEDALNRMRRHGVRRLPVVSSEGLLEGLIAFDDIVEQLSEGLAALAGLVMSEQKHERLARR
jgi:CBS domain-containing protein